jgi:hypothetical protein
MSSTGTGRARGPWARFTAGGWYFLVVIGSMGMLSAVPFGHAAVRLRAPRVWAATACYAAVAVTISLLLPVRAVDPEGRPLPAQDGASPLVGFAILALVVVACLHLRSVRRRVYDLPPPPGPGGPAHPDPAVAAALAARARRTEARRLASADPLLARELRIGRPDLPRSYDDGGLVDLNSAPPAVIAGVCDIPLPLAQQIADARARAGVPFLAVDDVFAVTDVPVGLWDRIRDRSLVVI